MATFHIHQDAEKENTIQAQAGKLRNLPVGKDKRATFAVLNNVAHVPRVQQGKTAFLKEKKPIIQTKANVENIFNNVGNGRAVQQKKVTGVPLEQFRTFSVYEDENRAPDDDTRKKCEVDVKPGELNVSTGSVRDPLSEIKTSDVCDETPMSVGESHSPMSIDKSLCDDASKQKLSTSQVISRTDRDRFYDVIEYQYNILEYFREVEKKHRPKCSYMRRQPDINYSMRTILVDWLVEVAEEYRLQNETLCLAVSYIDRFLSCMSVVRAKLQLVGTAAMFIAAKYEEIYPPDVNEFVFITDDTYTKAQVLRMEQIILKILSFDLTVPTTLVYVNTYAVLHEMPDQVKHLTTYLCELSLLEGDPYLQYLPSQISSAALALARLTLEMPIWCPELEEITSYKLADLKEIVLHLCRTHNLAATLSQQAIQEKYKSMKYMEVSTIQPIELDEEELEKLNRKYLAIISLRQKSNEHVLATNENVRKMISSLMFV